MNTFTVKPDGYSWNKDSIPLENFSIDFIEPDLSDRSASYEIKLGDYGFEHIYEFLWNIEKLRHSIEQLCFRHTKAWIDFDFDDTLTRLDCETFSEGENGHGKDLILVKIIPNGYVYEYNRIGSQMTVEECEVAEKLESKTAYVDAKEFIRELYTKIMAIADGEYSGGGMTSEVFRKKFQSNIIEEYLSRDRLENDDNKPIGR